MLRLTKKRKKILREAFISCNDVTRKGKGLWLVYTYAQLSGFNYDEYKATFMSGSLEDENTFSIQDQILSSAMSELESRLGLTGEYWIYEFMARDGWEDNEESNLIRDRFNKLVKDLNDKLVQRV